MIIMAESTTDDVCMAPDGTNLLRDYLVIESPAITNNPIGDINSVTLPTENKSIIQSVICKSSSNDNVIATDNTKRKTSSNKENQNKQSISEATMMKTDNLMLKINTIYPMKKPHLVSMYQYHCVTCCTNLKDSKAVIQHVKSEKHTIRLEEHYIESLSPYLPPPSSLQFRVMTDFVSSVYRMHSASEHGQVALRQSIVDSLNKLVKQVCPDVTLKLFGSSVTGFALKDSNININLSLNTAEDDHAKIPAILIKVLYLLYSNTTYCNVRDDFYSPLKVPRIIFQHKSSNLWCELRAESIAPVSLSSLLALYSSLDSRVSQLGVCFRRLAQVTGMDQQIKGHYPSVIFVLMVIHYLQQTTPPVLPVLHELISLPADDDDKEVELDISQLMDAGKDWKSTNQQSLGELLYDLLKYYVVEFDFNNYAVSIRQLDLLQRKTRFWGSTRLAIEDPIISKSNMGRGTGSDKVFEYMQLCLKCAYSNLVQFNKKINILNQQSPTGPLPDLSTAGTSDGVSADSRRVAVDGGLNTSDCHDVTENDEEQNKDKMVTNKDDSDNGGDDGDGNGDDKKSKRKKKRKDIELMCQLLEGIKLTDMEAKNKWLHDKVFDYLKKIYPFACVLCKRARHFAIECPDENIPKLQRETPLPPVKQLKLIDQTLIAYMKEVMLQPHEQDVRAMIRDEILSDIRKLYPKATLELFGSSANGFGHCHSDLDLCLLMNEQYQCEKFEIIEKIAKSFKNNSYYSRVLPILSARVPIVKLYIPSHKIEGDVSLENCLALENTRMLASYCNIDDRVRPLGYAIKSFAKTCDMCDAASGSLSSYAYVIMLIHYLQQLRPPVLPVLQKLPYGGTNKGPIIDGWNCYFFKPSCIQQLYDVWRPIAKNMCSISQLWLGFLRYYAKDFDWGHQVVTMRQLEPLTKFEKWWSSKPIAIEDPFNLDHNLGQAVSAKMRTYILMRFQKAYLYHCKHKNWTDIDELMDVNVLCGDFKPPKFILCDKCGKRGHRSGECPNKSTKHVTGSDKHDTGTSKHDTGTSKHDTGTSTHDTETSKHDTGTSTHDTGTSEHDTGTNKHDTGTSKHVTGSDKYDTGSDKHDAGTDKHIVTETDKIPNSPSLPPSPGVVYDSHQVIESDNFISEIKSPGVKKVPENKEDIFQNNDLSRSQLRVKILEQTGGSIDELRKLKQQLRSRAFSKEGRSQDKKMLSVVGDLLKKRERDELIKQQESTAQSTITTTTTTSATSATTESNKKNSRTNKVTVIKSHPIPNKQWQSSKSDTILKDKSPADVVIPGCHSNPVLVPGRHSNPMPIPSHQSNPILIPNDPQHIRDIWRQPLIHSPHHLLPSPSPPNYLRASPPVLYGTTPPSNRPHPSQYGGYSNVPHSAVPLMAPPPSFIMPPPNYSHGYHGNTPPQASPPWMYFSSTTPPRYHPPNQ